MASLKEIKVRIASIRSTQKITAAMKMVSSAKLHHTQTQTIILFPHKIMIQSQIAIISFSFNFASP